VKNNLFFLIQALLRYFPFKLGVWLRRVLYRPFFKHIGSNVRVFDSVVIKYPNEISLGDHSTINHFCYVVGKGGLTLGDYCMIGAGSKITTSSHNFDNPDIPMHQQGISFQEINVKSNVWIGFNAVILGNTNIGEGCIVAAGAVITGNNFEQGSIIGGVPARKISMTTKNGE
jgi:acetyltransferase-like isoleucine patch superfamily enzyme